MTKASLLVVVTSLTAACGGLNVNLHNSSVQKPSNVALYFSVETRGDMPVGGLTADAFRIYEDGQLISVYESKQTILNPEVAVTHEAVLLLDLSGSITESGSLPSLIQSASDFARRLTEGGKTQLAIYGFDGAPDLHPVMSSTKSGASAEGALGALRSYRPRDPSTNLNGAVVKAIESLEGRLAKSQQPVRFGTLVIFTDGSDRAHRVTESAMLEAIERAGVNVFVIGLGGEIDVDQLGRIGYSGLARAASDAELATAFDLVAARIEGAAQKFYLLSYCSPARAGAHTLTVEVVAGEASGKLTSEFDASGFGPGCDPNKKPAFEIGRVRFSQKKP